MKRGHPTKSQSVCLEKKFQNYYSRGISSETASQELGVDRKTGYAYYKKFSDNIKTINETTFFEVLKSRMKQLTISYDNLLLDLYSTLDSIDNQLKQKDANRQSLQNQKLSVIREIRNILNEKAELELKTPLNDTLEGAMNKIISKHEKS